MGVYVIAEVGINHNGSLDTALSLVRVAKEAGCDAVKFQKRTPVDCVPLEQRDLVRETPWGVMSYLEYKERVELSSSDYDEIIKLCRDLNIDWFASPWDTKSVQFLNEKDVRFHKIASACITDLELLQSVKASGRPVFMSTGMSTIHEVDTAVGILGTENLTLLHTNSTYPGNPEDTNLMTMKTLQDRYGVPVGYSGHETGLQVSLAAVALGAVAIERHITLDRAMWGSDHAASLEPHGLEMLVRDIRIIEKAIGDGVKRVYPGEEEPRRRLRRN